MDAALRKKSAFSEGGKNLTSAANSRSETFTHEKGRERGVGLQFRE